MYLKNLRPQNYFFIFPGAARLPQISLEVNSRGIIRAVLNHQASFLLDSQQCSTVRGSKHRLIGRRGTLPHQVEET